MPYSSFRRHGLAACHNPRMRRLAILLAVLVLLSVGLRLAAKPVVGSDWFRAQVEAVASRILHVEVTITDPIEPSISLVPGLEVTSLRFASPSEAEWWLEAEAQALSLRIRLLSLLRGRFETRMRANGVIARFALSPEQDESPSTFDLRALIEGLPHTRIENARIRQGRPGQAEGLRLEIEAASLRGCGGALDFEGEVVGLPLSVASKLVCDAARDLRFEKL